MGQLPSLGLLLFQARRQPDLEAAPRSKLLTYLLIAEKSRLTDERVSAFKYRCYRTTLKNIDATPYVDVSKLKVPACPNFENPTSKADYAVASPQD